MKIDTDHLHLIKNDLLSVQKWLSPLKTRRYEIKNFYNRG